MANWLKRLFGGSKTETDSETPDEVVEHEGYRIVASPFKEGGQYKTAGRIEKEIDGEMRSVEFIRADNHAALDAAVAFSISKARQIIAEQGDTMFSSDRV